MANQRSPKPRLGVQVPLDLPKKENVMTILSHKQTQKIRYIREKYGLSLQEAARKVRLQDLIKDIDKIETLDEVKLILKKIIKMI